MEHLKITKKIVGILILSLILLVINVFSQTLPKYTGYFISGADGNNSSFKYTREYLKDDSGNFITLYKIYDPEYGYYLNIMATHYKSEKKIVVDIDDVTVSSDW